MGGTLAQSLSALDYANAIRRARARLKREIAAGQISSAEIILAPPCEAISWPVGHLLACQPGWGPAKCRIFLSRYQISETKPTGTLTERQRRLLAAELDIGEAGHACPTLQT